jgi:polysaccharide chain length determinant protein (PEP-CTERM system associated)
MEEFFGRQRTLSDYGLIVRRRKWWLVLPCIAIFIGMALWAFSLPNIYRASTLILVEAQKVPDSYVQATVPSSVTERLRTITQQIQSRTRLEQVIGELSLLDDLQDERSIERYIEKMQLAIEVAVKGSDSFTVSYQGQDPHTVMLVANKLAALFIEENLKVREQYAVGTTQFLSEQLRRVRDQLEKQEKEITEFKQRYMGELPEQQEVNLRALDRLQRQSQTNLEALENMRNTKRLLRQQLATLPTDDFSDMFLGLDNINATSPRLSSPLQQQLAQRREVLAQLQQHFTDQYPDVERLKREVADLEARVAAEGSEPPAAESALSEPTTVEPVETTITASDGFRGELQAELGQTDLQIQKFFREQERILKQIAAYEQMVANSAQREQELMVLTRDYESTRQNYTSLLQRQMRAREAENLEKRQKAERFKVLDPASAPTKPWGPDRRKLLMMGLALGLGLGCGATFLAEYLDRSFRDPEEIKQVTGLPVLAAVPLLITAAEEQQRRNHRFLYAAYVSVPVAVLVALYFLWRRLDFLVAHTLQLLSL